ncbi:hypothetical protein DPMN_171750 [Dreissena polymorpha]|uniref:Uncharacterized protein n=1 Tax=Dreissena polymorpha TaxID=45954 RepID=A0A9D4IFV7_DREPO|nr:hypothetical protein DPMN_171750 [Dreissena polymorpha]
MQNISDPDVGILNMASSSKRRGTESDADIDTPVAKTNSRKYKENYREYWPCLGPS